MQNVVGEVYKDTDCIAFILGRQESSRNMIGLDYFGMNELYSSLSYYSKNLHRFDVDCEDVIVLPYDSRT